MSFIQRITRLEFFFLLFLFLVLFSCRKADTVPSSGELSISKNAIRIDTVIGTVDSFTVHSTLQWTASISPGADWLRIDKNSGAQGNTAIKLTIVSNNASIV